MSRDNTKLNYKRYLILAFMICFGFMAGCRPVRAAAKESSGKKAFRYIAIGNSVTCHPVCEFWFYECGMGASKPSRDYVHQTLKKIRKKYGKKYSSYTFKLVDAPLWELSARDRSALRRDLKKALQKDVQLLTFQYGDNIRNSSFFEKALTDLIRFVQKKSPQTRIMIIGNLDLVSGADRRVETIKKKVAKTCKVDFVDLKPIAGKSKYQLGYANIKDSKGVSHRVYMESVAQHPNDRGMAWIAKRIVRAYAAAQ